LDTFQQLFYAELQALISEAASKQALNSLRGEVETLRDDHIQATNQCKRGQSGQEAILQGLQEKSQRSEATTQECLFRINAELRALYDEQAAKSGEEAKLVHNFTEKSQRSEAAAQDVLSSLRASIEALTGDHLKAREEISQVKRAQDAWIQRSEAATEESPRAELRALNEQAAKSEETAKRVQSFIEWSQKLLKKSTAI
jgi:hypothetical protein